MGFPRVRWSSAGVRAEGLEFFRSCWASWIIVDLPNWTRPVLLSRAFALLAGLQLLAHWLWSLQWLALLFGCWDPRLNPSGGVYWMYGARTRARLSTKLSTFVYLPAYHYSWILGSRSWSCMYRKCCWQIDGKCVCR